MNGPVANDGLRIAYLHVRYGEVGNTFVRSEVGRLRAAGAEVATFSVRADGAPTSGEPPPRVLVDGNLAAGVRSLVSVLMRDPGSLVRTALLAARTSAPGRRGRARALVHLLAASALADHVRTLRLQHIHAHALWAAGVAMLAAEMTGVTYSFTTHGPPEMDWPGTVALDEKAARSAFVAAISHEVRAELFRLLAEDQWSKVAIVRCGVDPTFLDARIDPVPSRRRLLCVARLDERKGHALLLDAFADLHAELDAELFLIGDGPLRRQLEQHAQRRGLGDAVRFLGWQRPTRIRAELREARAFVLASFAEGLPVAVMEALACGRPVIAANVGAMYELVETDRTGWLVPPTSSAALVGAMRAALESDVDELSALGAEGARRVREAHDGAAQAQQLLELFHQALTR